MPTIFSGRRVGAIRFRYLALLCTAIVTFTLIAGCTQTNTQPATGSATPSPGASPTAQASPVAAAHTIVWTKEPGVRVAGIGLDTIVINGVYYMYYMGHFPNGGGGIMVAKSTDGLTFGDATLTIHGPGSNPAIIALKDGGYRMIYEVQNDTHDRKFHSATSPDGLAWTVEDGIRYADVQPQQIFTSVPNIKRLDNGDLRMYYCTGGSSAIADSKDEGLTWTKVKDIDLGNTMALDPDITKLSDGSYILYFTRFKQSFGSGPQYVASATSTDGLNFSPLPEKIVEPSVTGGMIVDPNVVALSDGRYRMYYCEMLNDGTSNIYSMIGTES